MSSDLVAPSPPPIPDDANPTLVELHPSVLIAVQDIQSQYRSFVQTNFDNDPRFSGTIFFQAPPRDGPPFQRMGLGLTLPRPLEGKVFSDVEKARIIGGCVANFFSPGASILDMVQEHERDVRPIYIDLNDLKCTPYVKQGKMYFDFIFWYYVPHQEQEQEQQ